MKDLSNDEWKKEIAQDPEAVIIDVRTEEEVSEGMIENAFHHDIHQPQAFLEALQQMDKSKNYYIYCRSGGRSAQACQIMDQMGFEQTHNLSGGISNWDGPITHTN